MLGGSAQSDECDHSAQRVRWCQKKQSLCSHIHLERASERSPTPIDVRGEVNSRHAHAQTLLVTERTLRMVAVNPSR